MKTITLQGTKQEFSNLYQGFFDEDKVPQEVEPRVYVVKNIDSIGLMSDVLGDKHYSELTNEEFMILAEEDGTVYSLDGFTKAFNTSEVDSNLDIIRIINVKI